MQFTVQIHPSGIVFQADESQTILEAALNAGIEFPHDCTEGICGTCQGQVIEGEIDYKDNVLYAITEDDQVDHEALFCSCYPCSDLLIHINDVSLDMNLPCVSCDYRVSTIKRHANKISTVVCEPKTAHHIRHASGQYLEIHLPDLLPQPFSIANAPRLNGEVELHIRHQSSHPFTKTLIETVKPDASLLLRGAMGGMRYHPGVKKPIICLAAGTGFAPIKAIIEQALADPDHQPIHLFWGVSSVEQLYDDRLLQQWVSKNKQFRYTPVLPKATKIENWHGVTENIHDAVIQDYQDLNHTQLYICGPNEMVLDAVSVFKHNGAKRALMYSDTFAFYPPTL